MPIEVDASQVHSIEVDPSQVTAGAPPSQDHGFLQNAWDFTKNAAAQLNPLPVVDHYVTQPIRDIGVKARQGDTTGAVMQAVRAFNPIEPVAHLASDMVNAQVDQGKKAVQSAKKGDYSEAFGHGLAAITPGVGPVAANIGDQIGSGDIAGGLGAATGLIGSMLLPEGVARVVGKDASIPVVPKLANPNPVEAAADAYALQNGLPRTAGSATGNSFVQGAQHLADKSVLGSIVANKANAADAAAMAQHGEQLANQVHPTAVDPVQAGLAQREEIKGAIADRNADADAHYSYLRQLEADPANLQEVPTGTRTVQTPASTVLGPDGQPVTPASTSEVPVTEKVALPVDLRDAKQQLKAVDDRMRRTLPVTQQRSSPGLKAIQNILDGPDFQSASIVDQDLGTIKGIARGADLPELKDVSQGLASFAIKNLEDAVQKTVGAAKSTAAGGVVADAGADALDALKQGREATAAKYDAADVLKAVPEEGRAAFAKSFWSKDAGIGALQQVAKLAPKSLPMLGRAFIQDSLDAAMHDGAMGGAAKLERDWSNVGPQTKALIFQNPKLIDSLDQFFMQNKLLKKNVNPSGSGTVVSHLSQLGLAVTHPLTGVPVLLGAGALAKIFRSPAAIDALTNGMRIPVGNKLAAAAAASRILSVVGTGQAVGEAAVTPKVASSDQSPQNGSEALVAAR